MFVCRVFCDELFQHANDDSSLTIFYSRRRRVKVETLYKHAPSPYKVPETNVFCVFFFGFFNCLVNSKKKITGTILFCFFLEEMIISRRMFFKNISLKILMRVLSLLRVWCNRKKQNKTNKRKKQK